MTNAWLFILPLQNPTEAPLDNEMHVKNHAYSFLIIYYGKATHYSVFIPERHGNTFSPFLIFPH